MDTLSRFRADVALDLMTLAQLHDRELDQAMVGALASDCFPRGLAFRLESPTGEEVVDMLAETVETMAFGDAERDELAADFAAIYLTHGLSASPYESVWLDEEGLAMQRPMFEARDAYARLSLRAADWRKRPDDHLVHQMQFLALQLEHESDTALADAARFLDDHTLRWLPDFARRVAARAATPFYAGLAMLTSVYLDELRDVLARVLDEPRPTAEEVERRNRVVEERPLPMPGSYVPGQSPSW
jgi:TorA maturation chaperone TorD